MNYYEFNSEFEYYALVAADSLKSAVEEYKKNVTELEDECLPTEVSKEYALGKYINTCYRVGYTPDFEVDENCILLIDESLL